MLMFPTEEISMLSSILNHNFNGIQDHTADQLISWSRAIRKELNNHHSFVHPEDSTINGLSHLLWTGETLAPTSTARNAVFYGDKAIDRSPCGTGTSARMAQWHAQGKLKKGDEFIHESIIGSIFTGRIEEETTLLIDQRSFQVLKDGHEFMVTTKSSLTTMILTLTVFK